MLNLNNLSTLNFIPRKPGGDAPAPDPILNTYPGAAAAYSTRKLDKNYAGSAISVRRSSDNVEQDIGFDSGGDLDEVALTSFVGANDGFVTTWYDQSGNSYDATQVTASAQPQIVSSGAVVKENGKPAIDFDGVDDTLLKNPFSPSDNLSIIMIINSLTSATSFENYLSVSQAAGSTNDFEVRRSFGGNVLQYIFNTNNESLLSWDSANDVLNGNQTLVTIFDNLSLGNSTGYVNANQEANISFPPDTRSGTEDILRIGSRGSGFFASMKIQEIILYPSDQSSNRTGIEGDINNHYNIY